MKVTIKKKFQPAVAVPFHKNFINISKYDCFVCIFDQLNAGLMSIGDFLQKHSKK